MSFKCPYCGKELLSSQPLEGNGTLRCESCGREFPIEALPADADKAQGAEPKEAAPEACEEKNGSQPEELDTHHIAVDLAQLYFSDLPAEPAPESGKKASDAQWKPEADWSYEEDIPQEALQQQREKLFQLAQATARQEAPAPAPQDETEQKKTARRPVREKRWQYLTCRIFVLLVLIIPIVRIVLGRMTASTEEFNWMQQQMIPSLMYWIAALILPSHFLRRTSRPQPVSAFLLLLPLIYDFWYLFPDLTGDLSPNFLLSIGGALKIAVLLFALILCSKAKKHPALKYKEAVSNDG